MLPYNTLENQDGTEFGAIFHLHSPIDYQYPQSFPVVNDVYFMRYFFLL